jgi:hypothetical protein
LVWLFFNKPTGRYRKTHKNHQKLGV